MTKQIRILGTGKCKACGELYNLISKRAKELNADAVVTKSEDMAEILEAGVMATPAVLIDGMVVHSGGLPKADEVEKWLKE